jgi:hypothetical protein
MYQSPEQFYNKHDAFEKYYWTTTSTNIKNIEFSNYKANPLTNEQIDYFTNEFVHILSPYYNKNDLKSKIKEYITYTYSTKLKTINDIPTIIMMLIYFNLDVKQNVIKELNKIESQLLSILINITVNNYKPSKIRNINKFKYAILCQGRNQVVDMRDVVFYNKMTNDNTFYIDIRPETNPDSISNLILDNLIYNGSNVPLEQFKVIVAKGCGWLGGHIVEENLKANRSLFFKLYHYLQNNGVVQIHPKNTLMEDISFDNISDLFTVIEDVDSILLFKINNTLEPFKNINQDILMEIALKLDIDDLQHLCQTNQDFFKICSSKTFWINKYNDDELPILNMYNNINDWINDYKATQKTINLLWLNNKESQLLGVKLGINLTVNYPTSKNIFNLPLSTELLNKIPKTLPPITHYIISVLNNTNDYNIRLYLYTEEGPDVDINVSGINDGVIIKLIKFIFLNTYPNLLYISDKFGISYGKHIQNEMIDVDSWYMENYPDIIALRKKLLKEYQLDFGLNG